MVDALFQFLGVDAWAPAVMVLSSFVVFSALLWAALMAIFTSRSK